MSRPRPVLRSRFGLTAAAVVVLGVGIGFVAFTLAIRAIDKACRTIGHD